MEVVRAAASFAPRLAISHAGFKYRYLDLLRHSLQLRDALSRSSDAAGRTWPGPPVAADGAGPRAALLLPPSAAWVGAAWGTWLAGGVAVPLHPDYPARELEHLVQDSQVSAVLAAPALMPAARELAAAAGATALEVPAPCGTPPNAGAPSPGSDGSSSNGSSTSSTAPHEDEEVQAAARAALRRLQPAQGAAIVYTSGTTGRPKGTLHTHASLAAMVSTLREAWELGPADRLLHTLPLHHVHGIVNALLCPLAAGAAVELQGAFSVGAVWEALQREEDPITVFMGVPTMYSFLLQRQAGMPPAEAAAAAAAARRLRLAVSGSAACPLPVMRGWQELSGQLPLERYGMTETGMILGNPLRGERRPGTVGLPFAGVEVRLNSQGPVEASGSTAAGPTSAEHAQQGQHSGGPGELAVRSPQLFARYWGRPGATAEAFDADGFFLTGDTAEVRGEPPYYALLGRTSVDVIKRGGHKVSALAVESAVLEHPAVEEVAVLGLPDPDYGEALAAVVALNEGWVALDENPPASSPEAAHNEQRLSLEGLQAWLAGRLPRHEVPTALRVLPRLPRNAMGKINKKELRRELFPEAPPGGAPAA